MYYKGNFNCSTHVCRIINEFEMSKIKYSWIYKKTMHFPWQLFVEECKFENYNKLCNKQNGFFFSCKAYFHKGLASPNEFIKGHIQNIWSHQVVIILWQNFHLISYFAMSII
jgi:hypothetical protein